MGTHEGAELADAGATLVSNVDAARTIGRGAAVQDASRMAPGPVASFNAAPDNPPRDPARLTLRTPQPGTVSFVGTVPVRCPLGSKRNAAAAVRRSHGACSRSRANRTLPIPHDCSRKPSARLDRQSSLCLRSRAPARRVTGAPDPRILVARPWSGHTMRRRPRRSGPLMVPGKCGSGAPASRRSPAGNRDRCCRGPSEAMSKVGRDARSDGGRGERRGLAAANADSVPKRIP